MQQRSPGQIKPGLVVYKWGVSELLDYQNAFCVVTLPCRSADYSVTHDNGAGAFAVNTLLSSSLANACNLIT